MDEDRSRVLPAVVVLAGLSSHKSLWTAVERDERFCCVVVAELG